MDEAELTSKIRKIVVDAAEGRRGLIAYTKMEAMDMDRRARALERDALERLKKILPAMPALPLLHQIQLRVARMDEHLEELSARQGIAEISRTLESDDIVWRAFEDILEMLEDAS